MTGLELIPLIVSSAATTVAAANALYLGTAALLYGGLAAGLGFVSRALMPKPSVPKPEDGTYNLKQSVPSLPIVLGRVKKAGDYVFLEEKNGVAYHIIVHAGHRIQGYVKHYLHDEEVTIDGSGTVVSPAHFNDDGNAYIHIESRIGQSGETAYSSVVGAFPTIWSNNHRGDGLASVEMHCFTAPSKDYLKIYPNQMPEHSAVIDGMPLYDPRTGTTAFTNNLAIMRLWHLTSPYGGKLSLSDMYLPDWINAANVCGQNVTNRSGGTENRYDGGMWFRANSDPIEVGRTLDQAAELVVYERADGLIGVHAGEYVEPTITLTRNEIFSFGLNANVDPATTVLAVRGRFTDPSDLYNTNDAAIYGNPYIGEDTERTLTVDNVAVQSHNHIQRLQKLAYIRRNGARVSITAHYDPDNDVAYHRFIRVQYSPKLSDAVIEITSKVTISLRDMTVTFSGIVVPSGLYDFNAATEEGEPGSSIVIIPPSSAPVPVNFDVVIQTEIVSGGSSAAYALATWDFASASLTYELEWEKVTGSTGPQSVISTAGETQVRSSYLADGTQYKFRLRTWAGGASSSWTAYEIRTATADSTPPGVVTGASATGGAGQATFNWTAPNSANYAAARIYTNTVNSFSGSTLVATEYGPPSSADSRIVTGLSAGIKYGFIEAINASGIAATPQATGSFTVT
ncbi:hypothetical protein ABID08_000724 [Rhizobium binae]|uniref:Fibronectin type-III domain-containing protein n=1 Tax=Rhizobium binae TaxID=1138190 RepID=A0ABV2MA88_9HYPH|nr:hypothetical protein [Rhizobium binae]MBX4992293.1 hypothetical protein [Rhizobium binae]NKL52432.1 hypothetical protein [Rhizobium leguminosarum bv. viciae]QSY80740.1 hypothetical protein J2J99_13545 [Rhizobium binae]